MRGTIRLYDENDKFLGMDTYVGKIGRRKAIDDWHEEFYDIILKCYYQIDPHAQPEQVRKDGTNFKSDKLIR
jgi:hypothetical protein